jgi:hypothetical protein
MYKITLTSISVDNFTIVIEEESREAFSEKLKAYVGPNSGWTANGLPSYINRFWNEFIDTCKV